MQELLVGAFVMALGSMLGYKTGRLAERRELRRETYLASLGATYDLFSVVRTNLLYMVDRRDGVTRQHDRPPITSEEHDGKRRTFTIQAWALDAVAPKRVADKYYAILGVLNEYWALATATDTDDTERKTADQLNDDLATAYATAMHGFVEAIGRDMKVRPRKGA